MNKKIIFGIIGFVVIAIIVLVIILLQQRGRNVPVHLYAEAVSEDSIRLSWMENDEVRQYNIYRKKRESDSYGNRVGYTAENEYIDKNLEPNTTYYYVVTQVIDFTESNHSAEVMATTYLGSPSGLRVEEGNFHEELRLKTNLLWNYSIGADLYNIYRSTTRDGTYEKIGSVVNEDYTDYDLMPETTYYYKITQVSNENESDYSDIVSVAVGNIWNCGDLLEYGDKEYKTIKLGNQCWFQENIRITQEEINRNCSIERRCYDDFLFNCTVYGGLYTYKSIMCGEEREGARGICPVGWRVPSDSDWRELEMEIGMREDVAQRYGFRGSNEGSMLAGDDGLWDDGELKEDNLFGFLGFNVLPGGYQRSYATQAFNDLGEKSIFWSSTSAQGDDGCSARGNTYVTREIVSNDIRIKKDCISDRSTAYLRCVRDF